MFDMHTHFKIQTRYARDRKGGVKEGQQTKNKRGSEINTSERWYSEDNKKCGIVSPRTLLPSKRDN